MLQRTHNETLLAEIKRLASEVARSNDLLQKEMQKQLLKERYAYRFASSVPNPVSLPNPGAIQAVYNSVNSVRIRTIVFAFDLTIGALTLQLGPTTLVFPNNTFGYVLLTETDFKLSNGDKIVLSPATWVAPKTLSFALAGELVGDALWLA